MGSVPFAAPHTILAPPGAKQGGHGLGGPWDWHVSGAARNGSADALIEAATAAIYSVDAMHPFVWYVLLLQTRGLTPAAQGVCPPESGSTSGSFNPASSG